MRNLKSKQKTKKEVKKASPQEKGRYENIEEIPLVKLTMEQAKGNFVYVVNDLEQKYREYGAVRIQLPSEWKPSIRRPDDDYFLTIREQALSELAKGKSFAQDKDAALLSEFYGSASWYEKNYQNQTGAKGSSGLDQD